MLEGNLSMASRADYLNQHFEYDPEVEAPGPHPGVLVGGPKAKAKKREYITLSSTKWAGTFLSFGWMAVYGSGWIEWSAFLFFYVLNIMGVVIGYHRYFSHGCFKTSKPMRYFIGILAQMAAQASVLKWAVDHRRHHARTERVGDTHSPYIDSFGRPMKRAEGLWKSHFGWLLDDSHTDNDVYGKGLVDDDVVRWCVKTRWFWYVASVVIFPALWALAFGGGWQVIIGTILIGGFLRSNAVLHAVLSVNSFGHTYGYQNFKGNQMAQNNWILAILTLGDGWHNNHHHHARSASARIRWYEFDFCGFVIWIWEKLGLVWDVQKSPKYVTDEHGSLVSKAAKES